MLRALMAVVALVALVLIHLEPCAHEDSNFCYWDASAWGNGEGKSFIAINDDLVIYF